ncbi:carbohydrate deacetylase [Oceanobacillus oncorhynchi subsp. incaldanensis]|uniref:Carbohydrate deacetylase n=1 Tax=Oceanobacillus oncorhynchi TaxID=545501 RepID=A0A0A1MSH7_9BACI|nr:carbohydrate deacetylase [Oceanobacillus oncorhynchi]GIO18557.1 carbohydrate deacetylase [Oceanobacillus oncorhynchi subsp. incaldanensis]CEI81931.1 hypothetical protein BN997_01786 [Oceanobacillus oncorhynchi]
MPNRKKAIINADDFGMTPGVTAGILYAHQFGIVTSTTAMVNRPFAKESLALATNYPNLGIGLHFVLDSGKPVSHRVPSLVDQTGQFLSGDSLMKSAKKADIKAELLVQLELLMQWHPNVTHIDSHHHMHLHLPDALEAVLEVAETYKLPIRSFTENHWQSTDSTDNLYYDFYGTENVNLSYIESILVNLEEGASEIMCHPAFLDPWLTAGSSYTEIRMKELEILTNYRLKEIIHEHSIELVHFGGIHNEYR